MNSRELVQIRHYMGKTQKELARLLCVSVRTIQSFEQGWRDISVNTERQLLFLLSLNKMSNESKDSCWEILDCPVEWRHNCTAWELKAGYLCLFINGTFCKGRVQKSWRKKIELCRECKVYKLMLPAVNAQQVT